ncbi:hypothetical protein BGZ63DRAFT_423781 [Mariannaea sp. PMI_226]|nr:hypothetical protein BGZ63DRAFT_423781 [Mariannaea sp. PMI_226]
MPVSTRDNDSVAKRKRSTNSSTKSVSKRSRTESAHRANPSLISPHELIIAELAPKYDVLTLSIISSTQIRKRIISVTKHLLSDTEKPRVVLLHARTADVHKLITVVERCKRVLAEESRTWYHYNQLFDLPDEPKKEDIIEETVLQREGDDGSESDDFEVMHSRFEDAVLPPRSTRTTKSMRIFLSIAAIPELKSKPNITLQSAQEKGT